MRPGCLMIVRGKQWKFQLLLISYCCNILERNDMSGVKYGGTKYPCIRFSKNNEILDLNAEVLKAFKKWIQFLNDV